ncbi:hypothetical protein DOY81_015308 [Sarcophaga bullata]|nr:hypothetical protein DOY81_015308 [Sarcophaga bullata]
MHELAKQIAENFPKEEKKSWFNREGHEIRGRLFFRLHNSRRYMAKQATSKVVNNSTSSEPEFHDEDSEAIQAWLKSHKCENLSEIIDLWEDTMKYRFWQMKHLKYFENIREFLNNWPSYKLETGHELLTMDFKYFYPHAMDTFRTRWLVYKQNIEVFLN